MKLKELLKYIDYNQKIILDHGKFSAEYAGQARHVNLHQFGDRDVQYIYVDYDIYYKDYIKIRLFKPETGEKNESN